MKRSPCFECICNPLCRNKNWIDSINECSSLSALFQDNNIKWSETIAMIANKSFFGIKDLEVDCCVKSLL